ncbi:MAG: hypothetical protein DMG00_00425 [Acidobacteria bacterium]|nr:MAG: hypothetical protein DMG00_00425 [Acidobacteriota bacterium]
MARASRSGSSMARLLDRGPTGSAPMNALTSAPRTELSSGHETRQEAAVMRHSLLALALVLSCTTAALAQDDETAGAGTMRPVIRGRTAAVSSMRAEATEAARRILQGGGNAFDAAVAGQAALAVTDFPSNGVGSDAVLLLYDAKAKKVVSINAEPRAPRLATIEWYQKNNGGKLPQSDGLLSGGIPGVVDAWYLLLDHWGTMTFEQLLQPAIELAEQGFPLSERLARELAGAKKIRQYPSTMRVYMPGGQPPKAGAIFQNVDLARTLKKLVEAEKAAKGKGRHEALKAARDRFYKGDIAREMAKFSEENGGLFRYEDFAEYTAKIETPVSTDYRGYQVYKNPSGQSGPHRADHAEPARRVRREEDGAEHARLHPHEHRGDQARDGRSREIPRRHGFHQDSVRRAAVERVRARAPQADRSAESVAGAAARLAAREVDRSGRRSAPARQPRRRERSHRRHELPRARRQGSQHGELRAEPPQRLRHRRRHGRDGHHLQLPRRLLLARGRRAERARAGQAAAQHAAEHAGDEGRPAVHDHRQPGRRRSGDAHHPDADERRRLRDEHPAGDRIAAMVDAQLPGVAVPAHDVSG